MGAAAAAAADAAAAAGCRNPLLHLLVSVHRLRLL